MLLDDRMSRLRENLTEHEIAPPAALEKLLPRRDGRSGKCFEEAEQIILVAAIDAGLFLIHGKCRAPNGGKAAHAWVEVPGGLVYDAVLGRLYPWEIYQEKLDAVAYRRYSIRQVNAFAATTDNHGPWNPEEEQRAFALGQ